MASYSYGTSQVFKPRRVEWGLRQNVILAVSRFDGSVDAIELPGSRWAVSLQYPDVKIGTRHELEAFWNKVGGPANEITLWDHVREVPRGSMRGSPTLHAAATRGATILLIQAVAGETLLYADKIKVGSQLFSVVVPGTADGSGVVGVSVAPPVRPTLAINAPVTWDRSTARFVTQQEVRIPYEPGRAPGFSVDLVEVF